MNLVLKKTVAARQTVTVKSRSVAVIFFFSLCFRLKWVQRKEIYTEQKLTLAPRRTARSHSLKPIFQLRSNLTPSRIIYGLHECCAHGGVWFSLSGEELLELLSLGKRGFMTRGFNLKKRKKSTSAALYTALQHFKNLFLVFKRGDKKKHKCHDEISLSSFRLGPVLVGADLLLWLLVQLHVRHQDVLLRLLRQAGVGAAVAGALIGPPWPDNSPTVQVDHADNQRHQHQARHHDNNQSGQMVTIR